MTPVVVALKERSYEGTVRLVFAGQLAVLAREPFDAMCIESHGDFSLMRGLN